MVLWIRLISLTNAPAAGFWRSPSVDLALLLHQVLPPLPLTACNVQWFIIIREISQVKIFPENIKLTSSSPLSTDAVSIQVLALSISFTWTYGWGHLATMGWKAHRSGSQPCALSKRLPWKMFIFSTKCLPRLLFTHVTTVICHCPMGADRGTHTWTCNHGQQIRCPVTVFEEKELPTTCGKIETFSLRPLPCLPITSAPHL